MTAEAAQSLHIDCPTGLAGDMLLSGLLDLGVPMAEIDGPLEQLGLKGLVRLDLEEARSGGLRGRRLTVAGLETDPPHRQWTDIRQRIGAAGLAAPLEQRVMAVFTALAEAEATASKTGDLLTLNLLVVAETGESFNLVLAVSAVTVQVLQA